MSTPFDRIYEKYFDITEDEDMIKLDKDTAYKKLFGYLEYAISEFEDYCYKDLSDRNDVLEQFNVDLNTTEIEILAEGMAIPFRKNKLNRTTLLNQLVYGKDFQTYSQANHIKEVRETNKEELEKLRQRIVMYTWKQNPNRRDGLHG